MRILKTPAEAFQGLPDYDYEPHFVDVGDVEMHYVVEGPADGPTVVLLHGQPSWSFLYRHAIADLACEGYRVYAPDLIGFGRSDKPEDQDVFTYAQHVEWVEAFLTALDLSRVSIVLHDWGGSIGLCVIARDPERYSRVVASNTAIVDGTLPMPEAWKSFRDSVSESPYLDIGAYARDFCHRPVDAGVVRAYDTPFPSREYQAGPRAFPTLVPVTPEDPAVPMVLDAWNVLEEYDRPFLTVFGREDRIYAGAEQLFLGRVPGAEGQDHVVLDDAGHFLQEDQPEAFSEALLTFFARTS